MDEEKVDKDDDDELAEYNLDDYDKEIEESGQKGEEGFCSCFKSGANSYTTRIISFHEQKRSRLLSK